MSGSMCSTCSTSTGSASAAGSGVTTAWKTAVGASSSVRCGAAGGTSTGGTSTGGTSTGGCSAAGKPGTSDTAEAAP
ncbi:hypothetical protein GCM10009551_087390 [Nocardiopsis tropica]